MVCSTWIMRVWIIRDEGHARLGIREADESEQATGASLEHEERDARGGESGYPDLYIWYALVTQGQRSRTPSRGLFG